MLLVFDHHPSAVKSLKKIVMFHSNLFLFPLCSVLFSFFVSLSSFPVVFGHSTIERGGETVGEKRLKQQQGILCVDSAHYYLSSLWFGKVVPAAPRTFPLRRFILRLRPDRLHSNLLSVCSAGPVSSQSEPVLFHRGICCCAFHGSTTGPKLLGAT